MSLLLLLGILFLVLGLVLVVAGPFPNAHTLGWVLLILGIVFLILALVGGVEGGIESDALIGGPAVLLLFERMRRLRS